MGFELELLTSIAVLWQRPFTSRRGVSRAAPVGKWVLPELPSNRPLVGPAKLDAITGAPMSMLPALSDDGNGLPGPVSTSTDEGKMVGGGFMSPGGRKSV